LTNQLWWNMASTTTTKSCYKRLKFYPQNLDIWTALSWRPLRWTCIPITSTGKMVWYLAEHGNPSYDSCKKIATLLLCHSIPHSDYLVPVLRLWLPFLPWWTFFLRGYSHTTPARKQRLSFSATQSRPVNTWYRFLQFGSPSSRMKMFPLRLQPQTIYIYIYIYSHNFLPIAPLPVPDKTYHNTPHLPLLPDWLIHPILPIGPHSYIKTRSLLHGSLFYPRPWRWDK
jgi:hypothetical protein